MGGVIDGAAFREQPVLTGKRVRLEPLRPEVLDAYWAALNDPEGRRLTGYARGVQPRAGRTVAAHAGRAARPRRLAAIGVADGSYLGEAVLSDLDPDNEVCGFRIALAGPHVYGRGYGTEIIRLVVGHALDTVGLHRLELQVYAFNPRARRAYEKCGFRVEGRRREALLWDGERVDVIDMGLLRTDDRARRSAG